MNKIMIEVEAPESLWARGDCSVNEDGTMKYEAKFCKSGPATKKPVHLGPILSLAVLDAAGKEVGRRSVTIGVKTDGEFFLQHFSEAKSDVEKTGLPKE